MKVVAVVVVLALTICPGCSWIFMERYRGPTEVRPTCNASSPAPFDFALFGLFGLATVVGGSVNPNSGGAALVTTGVAGLFLGSAITGLVWAHQCRAAIADYDRSPPPP